MRAVRVLRIAALTVAVLRPRAAICWISQAALPVWFCS